MKNLVCMFAALFVFVSLPSQAKDKLTQGKSVALGMIAYYAQEAKKLNPKSTFSAEAGRAFYVKKILTVDGEMSCSSCHTDDPSKNGLHVRSKKPVKPLALSANPDRFTSVKKTRRLFERHCVELYQADCSAQDKGDYLTYLLAVEKK